MPENTQNAFFNQEDFVGAWRRIQEGSGNLTTLTVDGPLFGSMLLTVVYCIGEVTTWLTFTFFLAY